MEDKKTWDSYLEKSEPEDLDTIMAKDLSDGSNKRINFYGVYKWIMGKVYKGTFSGNINDTNIDPGIYDLQEGTSAQGLPEGRGGESFVQLPGIYHVQLIIGQSPISRRYINNGWSDWV